MDSNASPNERAGTPSRGLLRKESREGAAAGGSNASLPYAISIPSASSSVTSLPAANSPALPHRSPSQSSLSRSASHRHSFASSPRAQRHPSFTQAALQELLNNPPNSNRHADPRFAGRDWRDVAVGELISGDDVKWADLDMSVEEATKLLLKESSKNVVLIRETNASKIVHSTFDYADLNAYLLVVVGLARPEEHNVELYDRITLKAREGLDISLRELQPIFRKEPVDSLQAADSVDKAIEIFGGGVHLAVVLDDSGSVVGILSQLRLVEFFWNEGIHFQSIDRLYPINLRDLEIGTAGPHIVAVNSDMRLAEALSLMYDEGLTSVPVLDNGYNVVGNISTFDVRHLTSTSSAPLLQSSCMHFLSIILSERGVEQGRDSFPVFYVNPTSTLAHTVAKLVATRAHRMWVVEGASPSVSAPETPQLAPTAMSGSVPPSPLPVTVQNTVPASAMPGAHLSGRLSGVVSLTDILNTFAKSSGMNPTDPGELRARRRRSSSSSIRPSLDSSRTSFDLRR